MIFIFMAIKPFEWGPGIGDVPTNAI